MSSRLSSLRSGVDPPWSASESLSMEVSSTCPAHCIQTVGGSECFRRRCDCHGGHVPDDMTLLVPQKTSSSLMGKAYGPAPAEESAPFSAGSTSAGLLYVSEGPRYTAFRSWSRRIAAVAAEDDEPKSR